MPSPERGKIREARLPCHFHIGGSGIEHAGEMIGASPERLIIRCRAEVQVGMRLTIRFSIPLEVSADPFGEIEIHGTVASISDLPGGMRGYEIAVTPRNGHSPRN